MAIVADSVGHAKRNVAAECDALAEAGVLRTQQVANRVRLATEGADVAVVDLNGDSVARTAAEVRELGRRGDGSQR